MNNRSARLGLACLVVTSTGWGLNWPAMKLLLQECTPLFARGTSGLCAALLIGALAVFSGQSLRVPSGERLRLVAAACFNVVVWMGFSTLSMRWLSVSQGALLVYSMPVWAILLAWPITGRRPSLAAVLGLGLCLVGIGLLFAGSAHPLTRDKAPGVFFALAAAVLFALGTVAMNPPRLPPLSNVAWQLVIGCLPMALYGWWFERPDLGRLTSTGWTVFVYMTLVPMGLCYIAWFAALKRLPPALASISTLLTPTVGVLAAAVMLGEPLGLREFAALALTLGGIACALLKR